MFEILGEIDLHVATAEGGTELVLEQARAMLENKDISGLGQIIGDIASVAQHDGFCSGAQKAVAKIIDVIQKWTEEHS